MKVEDFDQKLAETDIYLQMLLNQVNMNSAHENFYIFLRGEEEIQSCSEI